MSRPTHLLDAIQALRERLNELATSHDVIDCKAEGMIETALAAVESAANLLGEDEQPPIRAPRKRATPEAK